MYKAAESICGTQLKSKLSSNFCDDWPAYYSKAQGYHVWDLDDNRYADFSLMGIGCCPLGYADPDVDAAVKKAIDVGNMSTLSVPEEYELAELLLEIHPWATKVKYARTGGEAMAMAVRIARAATGRENVLVCGYHGWHDWYQAAYHQEGIPKSLKLTVTPFDYNNTEQFLSLFNSDLATVIMEPVREYPPKPGFLETIRRVTKQHAVPLIYDEITSGFRLCVGGAHLAYGINPDIAVYAKAISNGYPMAAVVGNSWMAGYAKAFISSTYWTDRIGPAAAIATIRKMQSIDCQVKMIENGEKVQKAWRRLGLHVTGIPPLAHCRPWSHELTSTMLRHGYLAWEKFYPSAVHEVDKYIDVLSRVISGCNTV